MGGMGGEAEEASGQVVGEHEAQFKIGENAQAPAMTIIAERVKNQFLRHQRQIAEAARHGPRHARPGQRRAHALLNVKRAATGGLGDHAFHPFQKINQQGMAIGRRQGAKGVLARPSERQRHRRAGGARGRWRMG